MSSKWGWATVVAVAGLFMVADYAAAQQPGGRPGMRGRGGIMMLAGNPAVQKEIGLEEKEREQLELVLQAFNEDIREQMQTVGNFQDASDEERAKMGAKMMEINQKLMAKYVPALKKTLKDEQFKRLQQINWQAGGAQALADPELAKALELSGEQQEKLVGLNREYQDKQRAVFTQGGGGDFQQAFAKMRELNQERDQKADELLTKDQQTKLKDLKGKPFDMSQLMRGGPGGPGGRPGGRPDGKGDNKGGEKGNPAKKE